MTTYTYTSNKNNTYSKVSKNNRDNLDYSYSTRGGCFLVLFLLGVFGVIVFVIAAHIH